MTQDCYRETQRTARREHTCCECAARIDVGERYSYASGIWDGEPGSYKRCLFCAALTLELEREVAEFPPFGALAEWTRDAFRDVRDDTEWLFPELYARRWDCTAKWDAWQALRFPPRSQTRVYYVFDRLAAQLRARALRRAA